MSLQIKEFPFEEKRVVKWIDKIRNDDISLKRSIKSLIRDLSYVWRNDNYQKRSTLINEATFTHDVLAPILKFVSPDYFKRWVQAQSQSARNRGVLKYVDVIGNVEYNGHLFENFFIEVSHGPFHPNPEQHVADDNIKLAKLGKDSLDRNKGSITINDMIILFHLHADHLCMSLMDYKFFPLARKIPLDTVQIPFFSNEPNFKLIRFIKVLFKYRCILESLRENCLNYNSSDINTFKKLDSEFHTHGTPKKLK